MTEAGIGFIVVVYVLLVWRAFGIRRVRKQRVERLTRLDRGFRKAVTRVVLARSTPADRARDVRLDYDTYVESRAGEGADSAPLEKLLRDLLYLYDSGGDTTYANAVGTRLVRRQDLIDVMQELGVTAAAAPAPSRVGMELATAETHHREQMGLMETTLWASLAVGACSVIVAFLVAP